MNLEYFSPASPPPQPGLIVSNQHQPVHNRDSTILNLLFSQLPGKFLARGRPVRLHQAKWEAQDQGVFLRVPGLLARWGGVHDGESEVQLEYVNPTLDLKTGYLLLSWGSSNSGLPRCAGKSTGPKCKKLKSSELLMNWPFLGFALLICEMRRLAQESAKFLFDRLSRIFQAWQLVSGLHPQV